MAGARAPVRGEPREFGSAGIRQAEELRGLVEGFAGRVIARLAEHAIVTDAAHVDEHRVTARDEQRDVRETRRIGLEERREQMPLEMVHVDGRHAPRVREAARERGAGQQRTDETGTRRAGDAVDVTAIRTGRRERLAHERHEAAHMIARGEFRHDAAIEAMQVDLRMQDMREQSATLVEDGDGAFITGGFDREHAHFAFLP
ncbi:MAG: hypothetical protein CMLOHMNK_02845 [Steroidobacteraceae bacterium]|nr:hypothetical protein [Steroidobacteraceae bacterium]